LPNCKQQCKKANRYMNYFHKIIIGVPLGY
jgi:hypothetical protein